MSAKKQVAAKIQELFPDFEVQVFKDQREQMHIAVSNPNNGKRLRIRVSESANYLDKQDVVNKEFIPYLNYSGWYTFKPSEIDKTSADVWILVWPGENSLTHALLFSYSDLSNLFFTGCTTGADGRKDFYWYAPKRGSSFAARPLGTPGIKNVLDGSSPLDANLNLDNHVDAWQEQIGNKLK